MTKLEREKMADAWRRVAELRNSLEQAAEILRQNAARELEMVNRLQSLIGKETVADITVVIPVDQPMIHYGGVEMPRAMGGCMDWKGPPKAAEKKGRAKR